MFGCLLCVSLPRQGQQQSAGALSFWMANASELLHFYKQDTQIASLNQDTQDMLAESVQVAFHHLVTCLQRELQQVMAAFLDESMEDLSQEDSAGYPAARSGRPNIGQSLLTTRYCTCTTSRLLLS